MKILITGGCGFIGTNLIRFLKESAGDGIGIRVLDNLRVGTREDLGRVTEFRDMDPGEDFSDWSGVPGLVQGDIRDPEAVQRSSLGADAVVHLAANTGVIQSMESPIEDCENNILGTLNLLEACRREEIRMFILASSGAPLGESGPPVHEELVPRPMSPYGASKLAGEAYCNAYRNSFGISAVALRFSNVYGPLSRRKTSVVAHFIKNALEGRPLTIYGDGLQTRDFLFAEDLAEGIWLTLNRPGDGRSVYQLGSGREVTVKEVANKIRELALEKTGGSPEILYEGERKGEVRRSYSDIRLAREELGFMPQTALEEGLERTFEWFLNPNNERGEK